MIVEALRSQYEYDKNKFLITLIIVSLVYFSTGLVIPYVVIVQTSVSSLSNVSLYNSIFASIGAIITMLLITRKIESSHLTRLVLSGIILAIARLFVSLIPIFKNELIVFFSTMGAMSSSVFFAELLYFIIRLYDNKNKMKATITFNTFGQISLIIGYFTSSVVYPHFEILFSSASLILIISLSLAMKYYKNTIKHVEEHKVNIERIFNNKPILIIFSITIIILSLVNFISPIVFKEGLSGKFVGYAYIIAALIVIFAVPYTIKIFAKLKNTYREAIVTLMISILIALSMFILSPQQMIISQYLLIWIINTLYTTSRHNLFKGFEVEENWIVSLIVGLLSLTGTMFLFILKVINVTTIQDVVKVELMFMIVGIIYTLHKIIRSNTSYNIEQISKNNHSD